MSPFRVFPLFLLLALCPALAKPLAPNGFVESEQPFLRSALIVSEKPVNRVRRGVLLPLGNDLWTCFDPDLLRYAAVWKAPPGEAPLSMDSMAAISYPQGTAKADKPPGLRGTIFSQTPELPGAGVRALPEKDIREGELLGKSGKVGPLPPATGRFLGIVLSGERAIIEYRVGQRFVREMNRSLGPQLIERIILVLPGADPLGNRHRCCKSGKLRDGRQESQPDLCRRGVPEHRDRGDIQLPPKRRPGEGRDPADPAIQGGMHHPHPALRQGDRWGGGSEADAGVPAVCPAVPRRIQGRQPGASKKRQPHCNPPTPLPRGKPMEACDTPDRHRFHAERRRIANHARRRCVARQKHRGRDRLLEPRGLRDLRADVHFHRPEARCLRAGPRSDHPAG